jgi:hypothetical protein
VVATISSPFSRQKIRNSSVGIALGFGVDDPGSRVRFPAGAGKFSLHHHVHNGARAHPASYPMGTRGSFSGGEADHSPPSSAEVKYAWNYTSTPQYVFIAWCLVKHRDNFTFTFLPHASITGCRITPSALPIGYRHLPLLSSLVLCLCRFFLSRQLGRSKRPSSHPHSSVAGMRAGVAQGKTVSPVLFSLYVNYMQTPSRHVQLAV